MTTNHELELKFEIALALLPTLKKIPSIRVLKERPGRCSAANERDEFALAAPGPSSGCAAS
jgi:hypothetical protein